MKTNSKPSLFGLIAAAACIVLAGVLALHSRNHEVQFEARQDKMATASPATSASVVHLNDSYNGEGAGL